MDWRPIEEDVGAAGIETIAKFERRHIRHRLMIGTEEIIIRSVIHDT